MAGFLVSNFRASLVSILGWYFGDVFKIKEVEGVYEMLLKFEAPA